MAEEQGDFSSLAVWRDAWGMGEQKSTGDGVPGFGRQTGN